MAMNAALLPEFDHEMASTRKALERVPEGKFSWKPHEKSGSMIWLAGHLANLPGWVPFTLSGDSFDLEPGGKQMEPEPPPASHKEMLATFDKNVAEARAAIAKATDADLMKPWSLMKNGKTLMTMPKIACLRTWVMNHTIHHRGQLTVYLRLNNIPVPALYGPSADEGSF
jgi:uncharacterized damage-inducible protein DinB